MAKAILPIVDDIIARGITRLSTERPSTWPFIANQAGAYFDIFAGWRGQLFRLRQQVANEVRARRLTLAQGRALVELAASEFFAELDPAPQTAIGSVVMARPTADVGQGTIRKGTRFRIRANPVALPEVKDAFFEAREPTFVPSAALTVTVPIIATGTGTDPNLLIWHNTTGAQIELSDQIFDATLVAAPFGGSSAGGSTGVEDVDIINLAKALYTGQVAPTEGALIAGALSEAAVKHVAVVDDTTYARTVIFAADQSWASGPDFLKQCGQVLKDKWLGFGARVAMRPIQNLVSALSATVVLTDPRYIDDTDDLRAKVREAIRKYLNVRPDFYTYDLDAIGGVISASDPRILTCQDVAFTDAFSGQAMNLFQFNALTGDSPYAPRYYLPDNGVTLNVTFPS